MENQEPGSVLQAVESWTVADLSKGGYDSEVIDRAFAVLSAHGLPTGGRLLERVCDAFERGVSEVQIRDALNVPLPTSVRSLVGLLSSRVSVLSPVVVAPVGLTHEFVSDPHVVGVCGACQFPKAHRSHR